MWAALACSTPASMHCLATAILPDPLFLNRAWMDVPEGSAGPIAVGMEMRTGSVPVCADFDFLQTGPQTWDIAIWLAMGGSVSSCRTSRRGPPLTRIISTCTPGLPI